MLKAANKLSYKLS